jgi:hypothetical protein
MPKSKNERKRKKKVYQPAPSAKPIPLRQSHTHILHMEEVGRKVLRIAGIDDSFLDRMTKQQLQALTNIPVERPRVIIEKNASVPRAYLRYIHSVLYSALDETCVENDAGVNLSLADAVSYGLAFISSMMIYHKRKYITFGNEVKDIRAANARLHELGLYDVKLRSQITKIISAPLIVLSQVQFRLYGFTGGYDPKPSGLISLTIAIKSAVPECISFKHFDKRRKAYRFCMGPIHTPCLLPAEIPYSAVFPLCRDDNDRKLSVYIQQHAILRLKERLRILQPTERTMLLYGSLMMIPEIVRGPDDQPLLAAHIAEGKTFGYFSFIIQDDKLFVLSFLPLTSALTPEGKRLQKILRIAKKDILYLKMDTLDFLFEVDFDQIPVLKDALIQAGIYWIKDHLYDHPPRPAAVIAKQTAFMKKYFENLPVHNPDLPDLPDDDDEHWG